MYIRTADYLVVLMVYVDNIQVIGPSKQEVETVKRQLHSRFDIKDLRPTSHFLGIKVERNKTERSICLSQEALIKRVLADYSLTNCKSARTPMARSPFDIGKDLPNEELRTRYLSIVGSIMHASTQTRPDIAYAVSQLSRYYLNPTEQHMQAAKRVLRYLAGTAAIGIKYQFKDTTQQLNLQAFSDSDWARDKDTRKSTWTNRTGFNISTTCHLIQL